MPEVRTPTKVRFLGPYKSAYQRVMSSVTKDAAKQRAKAARKRGLGARVEKSGRKYHVWESSQPIRHPKTVIPKMEL